MREDRLAKLKETEDEVQKKLSEWTKLHNAVAFKLLRAWDYSSFNIEQVLDNELRRLCP